MKVKPKRSFRVRLREPLVLDRRFDLGYALLWFVAFLWGIFQSLAEFTTVRVATNFDYNLVWGLSVAVCAFVAGCAALSMFFFSSDIKRRIRRKQVELVA